MSYNNISKFNVNIVHSGLDSGDNIHESLYIGKLDETKLRSYLEKLTCEFERSSSAGN